MSRRTNADCSTKGMNPGPTPDPQAPDVAIGAARRREPSAAHRPFSWLEPELESDHQAQFVALTFDVVNGIETCLQLLHSDMLTRNANQWADPGQEIEPILEKHLGERLLLLATASARMLSEYSESSIEAINERARSARR